MEGRWTIHANNSIEGPDFWGSVPVVPCDDAAIERGQAAGFDAAQIALNAQGGHLTPEDRPLFDAAIAAAFRAAGETP